MQQKHHTMRGIYIVQLNLAQPRCRSFRKSTTTELANSRPPSEFSTLASRRLLKGWPQRSWAIEPARKKMVPKARQPQRMNRYFSCRKSQLIAAVFLTTMKSSLSSQASEKQKAAMRYSSPLLKDSQTNALQMLSSSPRAANPKTRKLHMGMDCMAYSATSATSISSEDTTISNWQMGKNWASWPRGSVQKVARAKAKADSEKVTRCSIYNRSLSFFLCLISIISSHIHLIQLAHSNQNNTIHPSTITQPSLLAFDLPKWGWFGSDCSECLYMPARLNASWQLRLQQQ